MSDWVTMPLTDALTFREGPGVLAKDFHAEGVPLIRLSGLKNGADLLDGCNSLDPALVAKKWNHFRLERGDVLLSTSASLGEVAVVGESGVGAVPYRGIIGFRPKNDSVSGDFIRFMLTAPTFKAQIEAMGVGSVMKHFGPSHLKHMSVRVPPISEQEAIAEVLDALDDKIAANTKLATTADEWVRAGLKRLIATAEETVLVNGLVANRKELAEPTTLDPTSKYLGLEHLPRRSMWATSASTAESVTSTKAKFQRGDILFGKLRPYFHKVIVAPFSGVCSTDILVLNPSNPELAGFALASVTSDFVVERATAASEGTRMPRTSWKDLASIEVPWPGVTEAKDFSARVSAVRSSVESLTGENQTLAETRDALLPQLMSGELRVKDAEKVLENAGV